jgi:hypothetical protein
MTKHRAILERIGSYSAIAAALGVDHSTVWRWGEYGIPPDRWLDLVDLARDRKKRGVTLIGLARCARGKAEVS